MTLPAGHCESAVAMAAAAPAATADADGSGGGVIVMGMKKPAGIAAGGLGLRCVVGYTENTPFGPARWSS